jgi:hypothetical protein
MIRMLACLAISVAALSSAALAQDRPSVRLEPGLWKVLIKFIQNGQQLPDKTENRCYTAAEVDDPVATFATLFPNQQCTRTHAIADNTLSFAATCTGAAPAGGMLSVKGQGSYVFDDARRFTSSQTVTFTLPNQPNTVIATTKEAEYVGPCPN